MTSIEQEVLISATELHADSCLEEKLRKLMPLVADVDSLIEMAIKEGLAGLFYKNLLKSGMLHVLGREQRRTLQSFYYNTLRFNLKLIHDLKQILFKMNQKRIEIVLLQGIILLKQVYDDPGVRPMTDIDAWILKKDYARLISILKDSGYQKDPLYPGTFRRNQTTLDIHTDLLWADRIRSRTLLLAGGQEGIYEQSRIIDFEGEKARCLDRYDQVLYLSLHALKHNVGSLIGLVDIKNLVKEWKDSDWEALLNRCESLGQERPVFYILFLLHHLLGFRKPLKNRQVPGIGRLRLLEKRALGQKIEKGSLPLWAPFLLLSPGRGLKNRFLFMLESLFPRPEILRQVFAHSPDLKVWQLYCMRVLQLLSKLIAPLKIS